MVSTAPRASQTAAELETSRICCAQPRSRPSRPSEAMVMPIPIRASEESARKRRRAGFSTVVMLHDDSVQKSNYQIEHAAKSQPKYCEVECAFNDSRGSG